MKNILSYLLIIYLASCVRPTDIYSSAPSVDVDSLTATFLQGWNSKDSFALAKTIARNAVVMNDSSIHSGSVEIAKDWISNCVSNQSFVKTSSLITGSDNKIAYDAGTYSIDLVCDENGPLTENGNYNLVWTKQYNGEWKLTFVNLQDITKLHASNHYLP